MNLIASMRQRVAGFIAPPANPFSRPSAAPAPVAVQAAGKTAIAGLPLARIVQPGAAARWSILPRLGSITPQYIENILADAMAGSHAQQWELFDLMQSTWPRLMKNIGELKGGALSLEWELKADHEEDEPPTPDAQDRRALVRRAMKQMRATPGHDENGWEDTLRDVMDARFVGTTVLELLDWRMVNGELLPRATAWVHPTSYAWSPAGYLGLASDAGARRSVVTPFPDHKFLVAISKAKAGHPLGGALLRPLAWWWCAANFSADWLLNFAQVFGMPIRWAHYPTGSPQATIDAICAMLQNMGHNAWAAFPEGAQVELKEAGKGSPGSLPQEGILDRSDKQCDLLLLGQTLTSDTGGSGQGGGSLALGQVHADVRTGNILSLARFAAEVLNQQLVPSLLQLNYGNADSAPRFCPAPRKAEDKKANAERDAILINAGVRMPEKWFYERHGIPLPQPDEDVIGGAANTATLSTPPAPAGAPAQRELPAADETPRKMAQPAAEREVQAASAGAARERLRAAFAADLQHARDRLNRVLEIEDGELLKTKLNELAADWPQIMKDILADPRAARVLESQMGSAMAGGMVAVQAGSPDQPRDEDGRWTSGGAGMAVKDIREKLKGTYGVNRKEADDHIFEQTGKTAKNDLVHDDDTVEKVRVSAKEKFKDRAPKPVEAPAPPPAPPVAPATKSAKGRVFESASLPVHDPAKDGADHESISRDAMKFKLETERAYIFQVDRPSNLSSLGGGSEDVILPKSKLRRDANGGGLLIPAWLKRAKEDEHGPLDW